MQFVCHWCMQVVAVKKLKDVDKKFRALMINVSTARNSRLALLLAWGWRPWKGLSCAAAEATMADKPGQKRHAAVLMCA